MFIFILITLANSSGLDSVGKIQNSGSIGLSMSRTNEYEFSDYIFEFFVTVQSPSDSLLNIDFPSQFSSPLIVSSLASSLGPCTSTSNTIQITLNQTLSPYTPYTLTLSSIQNPKSGGTGNFALSIWNGNNLININKVFNVVGVARAPGGFESVTVSVVSGGSLYAGDSTEYEFRFKLAQNLQAWHWLRFVFPENFQLAKYPSCSAFAIEGNFVPGVLSCINSGTEVMLTGISGDLFEGIEYGIYITATNPLFSGVTGDFIVETGRNSTFTVISKREGIEGVTILPGVIQSISLTPYNPSWLITKKKKILYRFQFLLKNPLTEDSKIQLAFTNSFNMDYTSIKQAEYGLEDISSDKSVQLTYDISTKLLTITQFKEFKPVLISLLLEINSPSSSGFSDVVQIQSLLPDGTLVDQDTTNAKVSVSKYSSPTATSVSYPGTTANQATGSSTTIRINMYPQVEIPQQGYINLNIPTGFNIVSAPECFLHPTNMQVQTSPFCDYLDGVLTIQLYADTAGNYGKFIKGVESYIEITNIVSPESSGWYLFDFNTYSEVWDLLESGLATANMVASDFSSSNFDTTSGGLEVLTVLMLDFTTNKVVPNGNIPYITTDTQGGIDVDLPTMDSNGNLLFDLDLGVGYEIGDQVPCKSISGISSELICVLKAVPDTAGENSYLTINIYNFEEIPTQTTVSIHISGILYVQSNSDPTIRVTSFYNYNRIRYELETASGNLTTGNSLPTTTATGLDVLVSSSKVNATNSLTLSGDLPLTVSTSASPYILVHFDPTHEKGYCQYSQPSCIVNSIEYPCTCYPKSDIILVKISLSLTADFSFSINSLINPETVSTVNDELTVYLISDYQVLSIFTFSNGLPLLQSGTFLDIKQIVSSYTQGAPNTEYVFKIVPEHYLMSGGTFTITFPVEYSLSYSYPPSTCSTLYLEGPITCSVIFNTISVAGFWDCKQMFLVVVKGIKNPNTSLTNPFKFKSFSPSLLSIDTHLNVPGINLQGSWDAEKLTYAIIENFPSNANATADYRFTITPSEYLGVAGYIEITFPVKQFPNLPQNPFCRLSGYISSLKTCESYKNVLKIVLDEDPPYKILHIDVYRLLNFPKGASDPFIIKTFYDSVLLQEISTTVLSTTTQASKLTVKSINFYPKNEGEKATYVFQFVPNYDISLSATIKIRFPYEFDQQLGSDFNCYAEGLYGSLSCSVATAYTLSITSDEIYYACKTCSIKLSVYGVINPNSVEFTGQFSIGVSMNNTYSELNEYSGTVQILPAGQYLDIENIEHDSLDSRVIALMSFNLTTSIAIPDTSDGGALWFTFPKDYPLLNNEFYCTSSSFWAQGVPDCNLYMDTLLVNGQTEEFYGNLLIAFSNLPYPLTEVYAGFILIKLYDGINEKLLARTYSNLSPNRMRFNYAGPLIVVNHDQVFNITAGTMSHFIPISLDYPCALNLTLIPSAEGFSITPSKIFLQTGDTIQYFRISVPKDCKNSTFYIYWQTFGEIEPNYYVPILPTQFNVVYNVLSINIEQPLPVPRGGISLPVVISLPNAPDSDIQISVERLNDKNSIYLSDTILQFKTGEISKNFTIRVLSKSTSVRSKLNFELTGSNMDSYMLPFKTIEFEVFTDKDLPEVLSLEMNSISRTTASFVVTASKVCQCFYAYSLRGTETPSFDEVFFQGPPPYFTTKTRYGSTRVMNYRQGNIYLTGLTKETQYSLFIWLFDLSGFSSSKLTVLDFKTDTMYKAAELTLYYDQTYLTYEDIDLAKSTVALLLSLSDWRVILNKDKSKTEPSSDTSPSSQTRRLSSIQSSVVFTILDVDNSEVYPRPLEMIKILSKKKDKIKKILKNFDVDSEIKGVEIYMDACSFEIYPSVAEVNSRNVTVKASLMQSGFIEGIVSESDNQPFGFQVGMGLNYRNRESKYLKVEVEAGKDNFMMFEDLEPNKTYFMFLICSNLYPGHPDLLSDSNLVKLTWVTEIEPALPSLHIDLSDALVVSFIIILLF